MKKFVEIVIALGLIAGFGYFIYRVFELVLAKLDVLDPNIVVALIAGAVTIVGYFVTRYLERSRLIEQQIREQKLPTYEEFMEFMFSIFQQTKSGDDISNDEDLQKFFWNMNKKSILWLSDRSLKSYSRWKSQSIAQANSGVHSKEVSIELMRSFGRLLLDFRKDIGHDNKGLTEEDVLSMFINDWEAYTKS